MLCFSWTLRETASVLFAAQPAKAYMSRIFVLKFQLPLGRIV
jgi:hypothetical protein